MPGYDLETKPHISPSSYTLLDMLANKYGELSIRALLPTIETTKGHHRPVIGTRRTENLTRYPFDVNYKRPATVGTRILELLAAEDNLVSIGSPLLVRHEDRTKRLTSTDANNPLDPVPANEDGYSGLRLVVSTAGVNAPEAQLLGITRQTRPAPEIIPTTALMAEMMLRVSGDALLMKGDYFLSFSHSPEQPLQSP